jgi:hypothetical protein
LDALEGGPVDDTLPLAGAPVTTLVLLAVDGPIDTMSELMRDSVLNHLGNVLHKEDRVHVDRIVGVIKCAGCSATLGVDHLRELDLLVEVSFGDRVAALELCNTFGFDFC